MSDDSLRRLERAVRAEPMDKPARVSLYCARLRHGIAGTIRSPSLPLPSRPGCLKRTDFWMRCRRPGVLPRNQDFHGVNAVLLDAGQLNEVHRYMVSILGHAGAFAAWSACGVSAGPGVKVCLGVACLVAEHAEAVECDQRRFEERDAESRACTGLGEKEWWDEIRAERLEYDLRETEAENLRLAEAEKREEQKQRLLEKNLRRREARKRRRLGKKPDRS